MKSKFNKFLTLLAVLLFGFGQMWGETVTLPSKALTLPNVDLTDSWSTLKATHFYCLDETNHYVIYLPYATRNGNQTWYAVGGSGSSANATWTALDGTIFKGYSYYEIKDSGDKERYDKIKKSTGTVHNFRVKNCTKAIAFVKLGKKNDVITASAYEVTAGVAATSATVTNTYTNASSATQGTIELDGLDYTKEYVITVYQGTGGSDGIFYEMAFYYKAYTITYDLNGGAGTIPTENDKAAGMKFDLHDGVTGITAPGGQEFASWKDQDDALFDGGDEYTMPGKNVTLTAQWGTPATKYDITFVSAQGTAPDAINDSKVTLQELSASGFVHKGWIADQDVTVDDATVTAGTLIANGKVAHVSANTEFTAQWVATWTVTYYDGGTELGSEIVENGQNPADYATYQTKALSAFVNWYNDPDLADGHLIADISALAIAANTPVYGKWSKAYANSVDFDAYIAANESLADNEDNAKAYLDANYYALSNKGSVTFDKNGTTNNGAYRGLKLKKSGRTITWNVEAGKLVLVKAGVMVANGSLTINGGSANTIDGGSTGSGDNFKNHYFYDANEAVYVFTTSSDAAEVLKAISITDPYVVTYDATTNGGDAVVPGTATFTGSALTLPTAVKGTESFLGWFDDASAGNKIGDAGDSYTPSASITLYARWESISTDARLASITFSSAAGTLSPAFDPEIVNYTYTMPYPTADVPTITGATSVNANAQAPVIDAQASAWGETAVIRGVAESGDSKAYNITMQIAPKDGVSIIKVATTGGSNKTVTGLYAGDGDVNLSSSTKMDDGKYIGFILDGTTLQAGDRINVHTTETATTGGSHIIFYDNMTDKNELYETGEIGGLGDNIFTINASMEGQTTAYVYRSNADNAHKWNGKVNFVEVTRAMNPVLTAIQFNSTDVAVSSTSVSATLPSGTNLGTMTVTPTIVWNGAGTAAVTSNAGAWAWGPNTYVVTDKDGDATTYTITLTEDVLKHTVTFNTHGGSAIASEEVVHNGYLAAAPSAPEKEDYIFQYWSLSDGGAEVDVTTVQIDEDKTFHAVWASDGAIKLLDGSTVNHTNFITGVTAETVTISEVEYDCVKFSGTVSGVNGVKDLTRVIAYNATTNQTKIKLSLYNTSTSSRTVQVKGLVEGATEAVDLAAIELGNKEKKVSDWIEFNNAANRTIYIFIGSSAGDVRFLQVKVIEDGATPMKQAGEAGYSLNFDHGRFFGVKDLTAHFEGLDVEVKSSDCQPLNTSVVKLANSSISFDVVAPVTLTVTTNNNKTYYVTKGSAGTDNETAKTGATEFSLTAGTWYITGGSSNVEITNIAFSAPKCAEPAFNALDNSELCEGDPFEALDGTATVADAGVPTYQWYNADGDVEIGGATSATYTPSADGSYYVIATNHLAGYADNAKQSATVTVTHFASASITTAPVNVRETVGTDATLTVVAAGKNLGYAWYTCDDELGTNPVVIPGETAASLTITVTAGLNQYYKVLVSSDCGSASAVAKIEEWTELPQVNVSATTTWDWTNAATENIKLTDATTPAKNTECLMANINIGGKKPTNDATFNSQALLFYGENVRNIESGRTYASVGHIKFTTTVAGMVEVEFSDNGSNNRRLNVNGNLSESSASKTDVKTFTAFVSAGDVTIMGVDEDGTGSNKYVRISKIIFTVKTAPDYTRSVTNNIGTLCVDHNVPAGGALGATFYQIAGKNDLGKLVFEEVTSLNAGEPYVFQSTTGGITLFYGETTAASPVAVKGMIGSFTGEHVDIDDSNKTNIMYIANNKLWDCSDLTPTPGYLDVVANRAYIFDYAGIGAAPAHAPGKRYIVVGKDQATGFDQLEASEAPMKLIIDGQLFILRGEKMYNANGQLVK